MQVPPFSVLVHCASYRLNSRLFNTLKPRQNGCNVADDIFKHIFFDENVEIAINISLNFVLQGPIDK